MSATTLEPIQSSLSEQADFAVSSALAAEIDELISHYPQKRSSSLMVLHALQEHFGRNVDQLRATACDALGILDRRRNVRGVTPVRGLHLPGQRFRWHKASCSMRDA